MDPIVAGTISGLAATAPMTAVMTAAHRHLPWQDQYSLPPHRITMEMLRRTVGEEPSKRSHRNRLTLLAHLGYGAAAGGIYGLCSKEDSAGQALVKGMGFGMAVWVLSYLGWLPLANMPAAAKDESRGRNAMMLAAHLAWGASTGLLTRELADPQNRDARL